VTSYRERAERGGEVKATSSFFTLRKNMHPEKRERRRGGSLFREEGGEKFSFTSRGDNQEAVRSLGWEKKKSREKAYCSPKKEESRRCFSSSSIQAGRERGGRGKSNLGKQGGEIDVTCRSLSHAERERVGLFYRKGRRKGHFFLISSKEERKRRGGGRGVLLSS